jgi:hypothetical protein
VSKISSKRINRLLFVFVVSVALVGADLVVLAQNENTQDDTTRGGQMTSNTQNGNATGNTGTTGRRRRRGRRRAGANANANANMSGDMSGNANMSTGDMSGNANMSVDTGNANMSGDMSANTSMGGRRRRRRRSAGAAATTDTTTTGGTMTANVSGGEQTDLSGTYTGTVDYPEGGLTGDATLTITGNNFTLTAGSATQSGRVTAVTTRGYIGVTMMFGDLTPPAPGQAPPPLPAVSLRARRMGDRVTLMSVPGEKRRFSFSAGGMGGGGGARRGRRRRSRSRGTMNMNGNMSGGGETTAPAGNANTPQ